MDTSMKTYTEKSRMEKKSIWGGVLVYYIKELKIS